MRSAWDWKLSVAVTNRFYPNSLSRSGMGRKEWSPWQTDLLVPKGQKNYSPTVSEGRGSLSVVICILKVL